MRRRSASPAETGAPRGRGAGASCAEDSHSSDPVTPTPTLTDGGIREPRRQKRERELATVTVKERHRLALLAHTRQVFTALTPRSAPRAHPLDALTATNAFSFGGENGHKLTVLGT